MIQNIEVDDVLICMSNEGYWSMGDKRVVTGLTNKHIQLDNNASWYTIEEFRWRCYALSKESKVKHQLSDLLNECLESANQENSFKVIETDLKNGKFIVEFDIVEIEEDNYIGFVGY